MKLNKLQNGNKVKAGAHLAAHANGLVVSHGQEFAVDGDGFALDLVGPA